MKKFLILISLILSSIAYSNSQIVEVYTAKLSPRDHFNSQGKQLTSIAEVIRQDRANYHSFKIRDKEDQGDRYFLDKKNRATLEQFINQEYLTEYHHHMIVKHVSLVRVFIFSNGRIGIEILDSDCSDFKRSN